MDEYEVNMILKVDPNSNFFEADREGNLQVILDLVKDALYDVDDVKVTYIEVEKH